MRGEGTVMLADGRAIPDATLTIYEGEPYGIDDKYHDEWLAELTTWAR
jgi:hypothetical protein